MRFDDYSYLYPPRPEKALPSKVFALQERLGWLAQVKMNGTCNVLAVAPDKSIRAMNRHAEPHKLWAPSEASSAAFRRLPGKGWYVFVAELLHSKVTNGPRDTNYINDLLVADGEYLVGTSFAERQDRLSALFAPQITASTTASHVLNANTLLARCHRSGFADLFAGLENPEEEGLVAKNPNAKLAFCFKPTSNVGWQVKTRRPTPNYQF